MTWDTVLWVIVNFFSDPFWVFAWIVGVPLTGIVVTTFGLEDRGRLNLTDQGVLVFSFLWPIGILWVIFFKAPLAIGHKLYYVRYNVLKAVKNSFPWPWKVSTDKSPAKLSQKNYRDSGTCSNCGSKIH